MEQKNHDINISRHHKIPKYSACDHFLVGVLNEVRFSLIASKVCVRHCEWTCTHTHTHWPSHDEQLTPTISWFAKLYSGKLARSLSAIAPCWWQTRTHTHGDRNIDHDINKLQSFMCLFRMFVILSERFLLFNCCGNLVRRRLVESTQRFFIFEDFECYVLWRAETSFLSALRTDPVKYRHISELQTETPGEFELRFS